MQRELKERLAKQKKERAELEAAMKLPMEEKKTVTF